jgi:hypothetical protein
MGDWQGSVSIGGQKQPVAVYMIPLDGGRYEARFVADFSKRGPYLYRLRGQIRDGEFRFMDDIPFDVGRITDATDKGLLLPASLWSGKITEHAAQGSVAGLLKGDFDLQQTQRMSPELGKRPPEGAVVLFDGSSLEQWQTRDGKPAAWKLLSGGVMEVAKGGDIISKEKLGDFMLHLEFRLPYMPRYQIRRPQVNMCAPPLQWQSYDITFHAAKLGPDGKKTAKARVTVVHNGVAIHDDFELPHVTPGGMNNTEGEPAGLMLQDHGNPVQYRNIWVKRL